MLEELAESLGGMERLVRQRLIARCRIAVLSLTTAQQAKQA
jgi:hypothetical protein